MRIRDIYKIKTTESGVKVVLIADEQAPTVFDKLKELFTLLNTIVPHIDIEILTKYGNRPVHPIIKALTGNEELIARVILENYQNEWQSIYDAMTAEYNPIENYNRLFTREQDETHTNIRTDNSENTTETQSSAFDSVVYENTDKTTTRGNGSTVEDTSNIKINKFQEKTSGNIGVTTSQQMLQSEIDLRSKNLLSNIIMKDIVKEITIPLY